MAVPAKPKPSKRTQETAPRAAAKKVTLPYTGKEFLESLDDGREVWIYGERVYLRGSGGVDAVGRVKLMKLLWDAIGTEFGGRHELYEINYSGSHEEIRRYALFGAVASGQYERWKQFAETCMAEYDLDGWKAKDLVNTGERAGPA